MWVAQVLAEAGDREGAVRVACEAEGWPGDDVRAYEMLGLSLRDMGREREAQVYLGEAVGRGSSDVDVWRLYVMESVKDLEMSVAAGLPPDERNERALEALALAEGLIRRAPEMADSYVTAGACLTMLGRFREAHEAFEKAAAIEPDSPELRRLAQIEARRAGQQ
jgi:Flp pilus assembly protein TadD